MGYSITIEIEDLGSKVKVVDQANGTIEKSIEAAAQWRIRPFQKYIEDITIYIHSRPKDNDDPPIDGSNSSSGLTTYSGTEFPSPTSPTLTTRDAKAIKKKINLKSYGKFLRFLKTYALTHLEGEFKVIFHIHTVTCNTLIHMIDDYKQNMCLSIIKIIKPHILTNNSESIRCENLIGLGAFGVVYKGTYNKTKRNVAIKAVPIVSITNVNNLHREIFILEHLNRNDLMKDYIVKYYDAFLDNNYLFIVMEYLSGPSLSHFVSNQSKYLKEVRNTSSLIELKQIFSHIAKGVKMLHKYGITHRDIKPENIMCDTSGKYKLVDFGFATFCPECPVDSSLKWDHKIVGTFRFSPPEVLSHVNSNRDIDWKKCDLWSLGTVLFYLVTGNHVIPKSSRDRDSLLYQLKLRKFPIEIPFFDIFNVERTSIVKYKKKCDKLIKSLLEFSPQNRKL